MEDQNNETETYITIREAAERLGINRSVLLRILKTGNRGIKGKQVTVELQPRPVWLVLESSLQNFKKDNRGRRRKEE
ncbi:MAG TPA: hypothetical protein VHL11_12235 [Phototrophicaceae bacterium]|jgi:hypothetical protein|nr:hypothetical protein [Phototrophicaceae bacterium]